MITQEQFEMLLPLAAAWAEEQEGIILRDGEALTDEQMKYAHTLKIGNPEKIRLLKVTTIPLPEEPSLRAMAKTTQLISPRTAGLTLNYGIFIRSDCWADIKLVVHELVHTWQYERLGGIMPFLQRYLRECITIGYPAAPMEQEAVTTAAKLIGKQINLVD